MRKFVNKIRELRNSNIEKHKKLKIALLCIYPVLIILITEMNHMQSFQELFSYYYSNINVLLFTLFYEILFFSALFFISYSAVISMAVNSLVLFAFSCVEYYKFIASGTHFSISDLFMAGSMSDVTSFTKIAPNSILLTSLMILVIYIITVYLLNINIKRKIRWVKSFITGTAFSVLFAAFISVPVLSAGTSELFDVESQHATNSFIANENFKRNNFMAFFIDSMTSRFIYAVKEPADYTEQAVSSALLPPDDSGSDTAIKPNVVFIISESYADFRPFADVDAIPEDSYKNFDLFRSEGSGGTCIVPTFGGYTSRTEFEMLFGLPVYSLNTPAIPHLKIDISGNANNEDLPSMANFYKSHGYATTYIHPFNSTFYNRDDIYSHYGFDNLYFADNPNVPAKYRGKYIDDYTVVDMVMNVLESSDEPNYIAVTTMQNHVPYADEPDASANEEFTAYIDGIKATDDALGVLREKLLSYDKPTIVVFLGDHYPFFTAENNIYDEISSRNDNYNALYEQSYFIWNNYGLDLSEVMDYPVLSAFYLPNLTAGLTGLPKSGIINTVLSRLDISAVYSQSVSEESQRDKILDLLVYDLFLGKRYASAQ